jgi:hypothetical protein
MEDRMSVLRATFIGAAIGALLLTNPVGGTARAGGDETRFRTDLDPTTAADVSGGAEYREKRGRRKFSVEVEGFAPGSSFDVMIGGETVWTIVIGPAGLGEVNLDDTAGPNDGDDPFPADFPAIGGGELVKVGSVEGTLQAD